MANPAIIEVAIGLIFVYSLLSILVTQINTVIGNFLNLRAERLKEGLEKLLSDPVVRTKILTHPLIGMFDVKTLPSERVTAAQAEEVIAGERPKVGWIAPKTFVDVLTDVLTGNTGSKLYAGLNQAIEAMPTSIEKSQIRELVRKIQITGNGLPELRDAIKNLPEATRQPLLDALNLVEDALDKFQVDSSDLIPMIVGIRQIQDPYLQRALEAVLTTASSLKDAQDKLAEWFDNNMARATERFTREMQRLSLAIGLILALVLNVDTIHLARTLWEDPALRQAAVVAAQNTAPSLEAKIAASQGTSNTGQSQDGETPQDTTASPETGSAQTDNLGQSVQEARDTLQELLNLRLPMGWEFRPVESSSDTQFTGILTDPRSDPRNLSNYLPWNNPGWLGLLIAKLIGLGITTIAVAQGAPFWFDLLNRLTGKK